MVVVVMVVVIGGDYTDSFDDLADKLGIPCNTLRRYFKLFQQFIPNKLAKRGTRFNQEAKELFESINKMYAQRMGTDEIMAMVAATRTPTLDVRPSPPAQAAAPPAHQQMDLKSFAPALAALIPLAERFVGAYERQTTALEAIASALGSNRPFKGTDKPGDTNPHPDHQTGQDKPVVNREAVIARVIELHGQGLGQHAITTRVRREGLRMATRGQLSKSTVARILKGEIK